MKCALVVVGIAAAWALTAVAAGDDLAAKKEGDTVKLAGGEAVVRTMDVLPLVRNEFSDRFKFDCFDGQFCYSLIDLSGRGHFCRTLHVAMQLGL